MKGHLSTARDIATLFAAHIKDFPSFFNLFSRIRSDAGFKVVVNSSRHLLSDIKGIQGANFGFTSAAGFNGAVYVQRQGKRVVAVIFGARSEATLVKRMNEIVDEGFAALH